MPKYTVDMSKAPDGHDVSPLLRELGTWLSTQDHGAVGWFDGLIVRAIDEEWSPEHATRLRAAAFVFLTLAEGSMLCLLKPGGKKPSAVVLLDSEGDRRTVARSLEELLLLWAKGETGVSDLDEEESVAGRRALGAWLKEKKVKAPKAADFDLQAWLDGPTAAPPRASNAETVPRRPTEAMKKLGPKVAELASVMGLRADAPEVVAYVTKVLAQKAPKPTTETKSSASVSAPKVGIELKLSHEIFNDAYPPVRATAKSFIPYVSFAWIDEKIGENVLGVSWKASTEEEIAAVLGPPTRKVFRKMQNMTVPYWTVLLDEGARVSLEITLTDEVNVTMAVATALDLVKYTDVTTGLFVAWAATNGLLDEARFAAHADLLAQVKKRGAKGSDLVKAALPRGLWSDHLRDDHELRMFAFAWFKNLDRCWITTDLKEVFGKRPGPHGHDQPILDDDTWEAVDKASAVFDSRFASWVKR